MAIYLGSNPVGASIMVEKPDDQYGFLKNSRLIAHKTYDFALSETNFSSLTLSTSSQTLTLPATTYTTTPSTTTTVYKIGQSYDGTVINGDIYDYIIIGKIWFNYVYSVNEATINAYAHGIKGAIVRANIPIWMPNINSASGIISNPRGSQTTTSIQRSNYLYRKTDGTYGIDTSEGITSSNSPGAGVQNSWIDLKLSSINAKAYTTCFPVEAMNYIDPVNTILHVSWDVYEGEKSIGSVYADAVNLVALS